MHALQRLSLRSGQTPAAGEDKDLELLLQDGDSEAGHDGHWETKSSEDLADLLIRLHLGQSESKRGRWSQTDGYTI